jgi:hypothetical protein
MKDYVDGIMKCRCSTRMKKGIHVKVYHGGHKECPNCRSLRKVKTGNNNYNFPTAAVA